MLNKLVLEDFTAFRKLDIEFSGGVNIFIGDNGTGKTHILKLLYSALTFRRDNKRLSDKLAAVFMPRDYFLGRLVRRQKVSSKCHVKITFGDKALDFSLSNHTADTITWRNRWPRDVGRAVYIPVKDMLANAQGFRSLYATREIHFEEVYFDILNAAFQPKLRGALTGERKTLLTKLQSVMDGKVLEKGEQFFLKNSQGELEFSLLAEGHRKFALLWLLIQNGTLLRGSTLFWDEPEANINPRNFQGLVEILLHLCGMGVQVFVATHSYAILKEFDLQKQAKHSVKYFSLFRDKQTGQITHTSATEYPQIDPNRIAEEYKRLYEEDVRRALARGRDS